MNLIYFVLGIMILAGAMFALSGVTTRKRDFVDKDVDGAADEPRGLDEER